MRPGILIPVKEGIDARRGVMAMSLTLTLTLTLKLTLTLTLTLTHESTEKEVRRL